jgi:hypothetical protein
VHLSTLIDDLLAYSRLERRSFASRPLTCPRCRALAGRPALRDRPAVEVRRNCRSRGLGRARGIGQLLANLIDNAITYSRSRAPAVVIGGRETAQHVIWVQDNGIGFDMRYHDRSLRCSTCSRGRLPGTGVGRRSPRKSSNIGSHLGGERRRPGQYVLLRAAAAQHRLSGRNAMSIDPISILLVEDNPMDVELTVRAFKRHHMSNPIRVVRDGQEALDYLYGRGKFADPGTAPVPGASSR